MQLVCQPSIPTHPAKIGFKRNMFVDSEKIIGMFNDAVTAGRPIEVMKEDVNVVRAMLKVALDDRILKFTVVETMAKLAEDGAVIFSPGAGTKDGYTFWTLENA